MSRAELREILLAHASAPHSLTYYRAPAFIGATMFAGLDADGPAFYWPVMDAGRVIDYRLRDGAPERWIVQTPGEADSLALASD